MRRPLEVEKLYSKVPQELYVVLASLEELVKEGNINLLQYLLWLEDIIYEQSRTYTKRQRR